MSDLQIHLNQLIFCFSHWSGQPPVWSQILIAEDTNIKYVRISGVRVPHIPRSALATPEEYAVRFDAHLSAGHAWINMNAAGIVNETLLVVIELPHYRSSVARSNVSVNFSGPTLKDGEPVWDASAHIKIID